MIRNVYRKNNSFDWRTKRLRLDTTILDRTRMWKKYTRFFILLFVNSIVFLVLFGTAEISCRIYRDGFTKAVAGIIHYFNEVPLGWSDLKF
jgi:hypothetical protein